jgi:squalene synthase HpnC
MRSNQTGVDHYENFPVASWLCPAHLRAPIRAIYYFARAADDVADEGDDSAHLRLAKLAQLQGDLQRVAAGEKATTPYAAVVEPLRPYLAAGLPRGLLEDLLSAFMQDVTYTAQSQRYENWPDLLSYCQRSANPIGRLLLHLYNVNKPTALIASDAVCSALQLTNFWQDLSQDIPRGRFYIPVAVLAQHGLPPQTQLDRVPPNIGKAVVRTLVEHARTLMQAGIPVVKAVKGRGGWELAVVIEGGLQVLRKIERRDFDAAHKRVKLNTLDGIEVICRALVLKCLSWFR